MTNCLNGELTLPGDKSISHRALMLLAIAQGEGVVRNLSAGQDVLSTLRCLQALGVSIVETGENEYRVTGNPRLTSPNTPLDCGNSGTTIRLLSGLLSGAGVAAVLTGDDSLLKRPMARVIHPLTDMGANIEALGAEGRAPLKIEPNQAGLHPICYPMPMASAQVKSAILLAGLYASAEAPVIVKEPLPSRDHTERMLSALGAAIKTEGSKLALYGRQPDLTAQDIRVPGDISSAAFWLVGAAILPGSEITIRHVGINPLRTGVLDVLQAAGADIAVLNPALSAGEPYADIRIHGSVLKGNIEITPAMVPSLIDEIPILTVLGLFTDGVFTLRGAEELRFKESNRLGAMIDLLQRLGVDVVPYEDGYSFHGNPDWNVPRLDAPLQTHHDHRLVMALEILNLRAAHPLPIEGKEWAAISYPTFWDTLETIRKVPLT